MWNTMRKIPRSHNEVIEKWGKIKIRKQKENIKKKTDYKCIDTSVNCM